MQTAVGKYENAQAIEDSTLSRYKNEINSYISGNRDVTIADEVKQYIDSKMNFATTKWVYTCKAEYTANTVSAGTTYINNTTIFNSETSGDSFQAVSQRDSNGYIRINKSGFYVITMNGSMCGVLSNTAGFEIYNFNKELINSICVYVDYTHSTDYYNNTNGSVTVYLEKDNYLKPYFYRENATKTKSFYAGIAIYKCFD